MRMEHILNDLKIYDYVPEIKQFLLTKLNNPIEVQNYKNSGKAEPVYTIVEKLDNGFLTYIIDKWFLIDESTIKPVVVSDYITDQEQLKTIHMFEHILNTADINDKSVTVRINENLRISFSTKNGDMFVNEQKVDKQTTLENVFQSPIIPILKKDMYYVLETVRNNINKFVELDVCIKNSNILKPFLEAVAFNYKDDMYLYLKDRRTGSSFYKYESALELINDVRKELDFDLTEFYKNKLSKEMIKYKSLDDQEKEINIKLKDVNESIDAIKYEKELSPELNQVFDELLIYKHELHESINNIKAERSAMRKEFIRQK